MNPLNFGLTLPRPITFKSKNTAFTEADVNPHKQEYDRLTDTFFRVFKPGTKMVAIDFATQQPFIGTVQRNTKNRIDISPPVREAKPGRFTYVKVLPASMTKVLKWNLPFINQPSLIETDRKLQSEKNVRVRFEQLQREFPLTRQERLQLTLKALADAPPAASAMEAYKAFNVL